MQIQNYDNGDVIVEDIVMQVGNTFDSTGSTMQLVGMRVAIESSPNIDEFNFREEKYLAGRLNAGETAVGLLVDVSNVLAEFGTETATKHTQRSFQEEE